MKSTAIALVSLLLFLSIPTHLKTVSAEASSQEVCVDFGSKAAGDSVNGLGAVHPRLYISSTNNARVVKEGADPIAYGGNLLGINNVPNACIGPGAGFADLGAAAGNFSVDSRLHDYVFTFAPGTSVSEFSLRIVDHGDFNPGQLNGLGYELMRSGDLDGAIRVLVRNVETYPSDANAYDSLGEVYMEAGKKDLAIKNYRRSLDLDPHNDHAKAMLKKLGTEVTR